MEDRRRGEEDHHLTRNTSLLLIALVAVIGLIFLIARCKLNAFVALMLASLFVGLCSGMKPAAVPKAFLEGLGKVLGDIAMVIGLGTVLGKMLSESGGAEVIARRLVRALGEKRLHWAVMFIAFIVGIPVFFAVGLVLLVPIVFTLARETKTPLLRLGLPLAAGLSVVHGLVPPHPGPVAAMGIINDLAGRADMGKTIIYALLVGLPTAIVAASEAPAAARYVQEAMSGGTLRIYTHDDVVGVELGGALKNVMAVATGILEGVGLGFNSRAALLTRGLAEMTRLGTSLGARAATFAGLAGVGDLVLTCTGTLSRNRALGVEIGQGKTLEEARAGKETVAEGVVTTASTIELAAREGVEMPIAEMVYRILFDHHPAKLAAQELMMRELRSEQDA